MNLVSFVAVIIQKISVKAPGRINLIGEHTDYNGGYVLPAAINLGIQMEVETTSSDRIHLHAADLNETFEFCLNDEDINTKTNWPKYSFGVVKELQKLGTQFSGFSAKFWGDVPQGSGMSSSAALECSLAFALNQLFELQLNNWDLIKAGQMAEHNYVGTKCGIMDQFASVLGKQNQAIFLDCQNLKYEYVSLNLNNYEILLLNTNVAHSLADSEYNNRRAECEEGLSILKEKGCVQNSLRDLNSSEIEKLKPLLSTKVFNRCAYVIEENERVLKAKAALQKNDLIILGKLMYQSHEGLRKQYEVSCDELDFLVDFAKEEPAILGSRMMGGGFGGSTISIISKAKKAAFIEKISLAYQKQFGITLTPYSVTIEDGASVLSK